mmetsp:Transcript_15044/g.30618  ORF Transcript_15044/g.30618 Transcript_15044/m.30618 type:complete len:377 (+) Transcript_15044:166-1296(+)|eukprot:scaffold10570_cov176-Amphora_coffeaeformis.AAC.33
MASPSVTAAIVLVLTLRVQRFKWIHQGLLIVEGVTISALEKNNTSSGGLPEGKTCTVAIAGKPRKPRRRQSTNRHHIDKEGKDNLECLRRAADLCQVDKLGTNDATSNLTGSWVDLSITRSTDCAAENVFLTIECLPTTERNRKGSRMVECTKFLNLRREYDREYDSASDASLDRSTNDDMSFGFHLKILRHELFADWIIQEYGDLALHNPILDVAGGNGELARALLRRGVPKVILVDPKPRLSLCNTKEQEEIDKKIIIIEKPLVGDGSDLLDHSTAGVLIRQCKLLVGLHPDQATEAIIDLSQRRGNVPFALLPCCVMPSLFPTRRQRHEDPVRSYRTFCQYLIDKGEGCNYKAIHLPFDGRNKVIYKCIGTEI